jgi:hypothetical protein
MKTGPNCYLCGEEIEPGDPFFEWSFPLRFSHSSCELRGRTIEVEETQRIAITPERLEEAERNAKELGEVMRVVSQRKMDKKEEATKDLRSRSLSLRILRRVRAVGSSVVGSLLRKK